MNAIWTPQTNVVFELVPSGDIDVDQNDAKTSAALGKAYGLKGAAPVPGGSDGLGRQELGLDSRSTRSPVRR